MSKNNATKLIARATGCSEIWNATGSCACGASRYQRSRALRRTKGARRRLSWYLAERGRRRVCDPTRGRAGGTNPSPANTDGALVWTPPDGPATGLAARHLQSPRISVNQVRTTPFLWSRYLSRRGRPHAA